MKKTEKDLISRLKQHAALLRNNPADSLVNAKVPQIQKILSYLSSEKRDSWIHVASILKNIESEIAFKIWDDWSKTSSKYNPEDQEKRWKGLKPLELCEQGEDVDIMLLDISTVDLCSVMLRVTIELVPYGIESEKENIGEITIWNDKTGTLEVGNYVAQVGPKKYRVKGHKRSESIYKLLKKVMEKY